MAAAVPSSPAPPARSASSSEGWLHGRTVDLWIGCGLLYIVTLPLVIAVGAATGTSYWPAAIVVAIGLFASGPHYGATLLRVYETREDRHRYVFFTVWVTLFLAVLFLLGLRDLVVASWLLTLYVTWSPWHFAGQNYGLALMFLRRRGVPIEPGTKRLFYASFLLSFVLAFLSIHVAQSNVVYAAGASAQIDAVRILRLGVPGSWAALLAVVAGAGYLATLGLTVARLRRAASWRVLAPAGVLVLLQALWFSVPGAVAVTSGNSLSALPFAAIWISLAHSLQYLWVTSYYARREHPESRIAPYYGKVLLVGSAVTIAPTVLFAPAFFGSLPWDAGLAVLVFAVVNLHHFLLDGAIWKLRDGRVARALLRSESPSEEAEPIGGPVKSWLRPLVYVAGAACLAIPVVQVWEIDVLNASSDLDRQSVAAERLKWIGRDSTIVHTRLGTRYAAAGDFLRARAEYEQSLALFPTADAWVGLGQLHEREGDRRAAREAYDQALALAPGHARAQRALTRLEQAG